MSLPIQSTSESSTGGNSNVSPDKRGTVHLEYWAGICPVWRRRSNTDSQDILKQWLLYERSFDTNDIILFDHDGDPNGFMIFIAPFVNAYHVPLGPHRDFGAARDFPW